MVVQILLMNENNKLTVVCVSYILNKKLRKKKKDRRLTMAATLATAAAVTTTTTSPTAQFVTRSEIEPVLNRAFNTLDREYFRALNSSYHRCKMCEQCEPQETDDPSPKTMHKVLHRFLDTDGHVHGKRYLAHLWVNDNENYGCGNGYGHGIFFVCEDETNNNHISLALHVYDEWWSCQSSPVSSSSSSSPVSSSSCCSDVSDVSSSSSSSSSLSSSSEYLIFSHSLTHDVLQNASIQYEKQYNGWSTKTCTDNEWLRENGMYMDKFSDETIFLLHFLNQQLNQRHE